MNFGIEIGTDGLGRMTWGPRKNALVNVFWALKTPKGAFFSDPDFGLDLTGIDKIVPEIVDTAVQRYEQALDWMIDAQKARVINVTGSIPADNSRLDIRVKVVQNDGVTMQFSTFVEVGGVSGGFIFP